MKKFIGLIVILALIALGWWTLAPLLFNETVDEAFPEIIKEVTEESRPEIIVGQDVIMEEAMPKMEEAAVNSPIQSGNFQNADDFHKGSGKAKIFSLEDGSHVLRFEDFNVTNGPDLRVYLVSQKDPQKEQVSEGLLLAKLKGNIGNQNYVIPSDIDPNEYGSVVIYCKPFQVVFSYANLGQ